MNAEAAAALARLPPLKTTLAEAGLLADKRLGQHFLFDLNLCRKIARLSEVGPEDVVVEVGPGPGGLTRALLETGARVVAFERDPRFSEVLAPLGQCCPGRFSLIQDDAMRVDEAAALRGVTGSESAHLVSNLPYNVGTALFLKWVLGSWRPDSLTLMFQREVAERIVAAPGAGAYGRLSIIAQTLCEARIVMDLPARAFTPPPKVDSAVIRARPRPVRPPDPEISALETLTAAAFGQRRKMLRSSLKAFGGADLCRAASLNPDARAETVPPDAFLHLARTWLATRSDAPPHPGITGK